MTRILVALLCLLTALAAEARVDRSIRSGDTLRVVKIFSDSRQKHIVADKRKVKPGDKFVASAAISWPKNVTGIEIFNLRTKVKHKLSNKEFGSNFKSVFKAFIRRNSTSSKGLSTDDAVEEMSKLLANTFYMLEGELFIGSSLVIDDEHTFTLTPLNADAAPGFDLMYNPDEPFTLYVSEEMLADAGIDLSKGPVRFAVSYSGGGKTYPITNYFVIEKAE